MAVSDAKENNKNVYTVHALSNVKETSVTSFIVFYLVSMFFFWGEFFGIANSKTFSNLYVNLYDLIKIICHQNSVLKIWEPNNTVWSKIV